MSEFKVINRADSTIDVLIYDTIGADWMGGISAKEVAKELRANKKAKTINVSINSSGGSVWDGTAIYNALIQHPAKVNVSIDGAALSIASLVAMAGDDIAIAENASMMVHDPMDILIYGSAEDMRETADKLDKIKDSLVNTYSARTGVASDEVAKMMRDETWFTASEAVEKGFADRVLEAKKMAACSLDMKCFKNVPEWFRNAITDQADDAETQTEAADVTETVPMADDKQQVTTTGASDQPKLATINQLKATFPDSDAEWRESCLTQEMTLDQAKDAWHTKVGNEYKAQTGELKDLQEKNRELEEKLAAATKKPEPSDTVNFRSGSQDTDDGDDFVAVAKRRAKDDEIALGAAKKLVAKENPALYDAYRETFRGPPKSMTLHR